MTARPRKKPVPLLAATPPAAAGSAPLHVQIRESIRRQVREGELIDENGRLMTEAELGRHFGVSRITIRNAILAAGPRGHVRAYARPRHVPALQPAENWVGRLMGFSETIRDAGYQAGAKVLQQGMTNRHDADVRDATARARRVAAQAASLRRRHADCDRTRLLSPDIGLELDKRDLTSIIMYSVFEDELGHPIREAKQSISASIADSTSAKLLGVRAGSPYSPSNA